MSRAKERVVVGMSGGVDSSVAAALLCREGYDVIGITLRLPVFGNGESPERACCGVKGIEDARSVAGKLGIPFYVWDFRKEFEKSVIADFCRAYSEGRTPNPCVRCNERIKFGKLLHRARSVGAEFLATGHYVAKVRNTHTGRFGLMVGKGDDDQSYFLYGLTQAQLQYALFPLRDCEKKVVRRMAADLGLPVHSKPGSQDLCFLPNGKYRQFLKKQCPEAFRPGPIVHVSGDVLGWHEGIAAYTVGQRRGLGIARSEPLYVVGFRPDENTVVVGEKTHVYRKSVLTGNVNWMIDPPREPMPAQVKIRYNHPGADAWIFPIGQERARIEFRQAQEAPSPGQAAVFYRNGQVLGGGTIKDSPLSR